MLVANKRYGISGVVPAKNPELAVSTVVSIAPGTTILAGTALGQIPGTGSNVNEVQRITPTGTISGGTFRIGTADGSLTVALAYNATAAQIQAALETILGAGNVACSGGAINSAYVQVTFQGLCGGLKMPLLTITNNLTGISPVLTTTSTTSGKPAGGYFDAYNDANSNGTEVCKAVMQFDVTADNFGKITFGQQQGGGDFGSKDYTAPAWIRGIFKGSDIIGLDANGLADLQGRYIHQGASISDAMTLISF